MVKEELVNRSPLRIFEKSIHGGVGKGNIGVIASRKGIGKTACLVHIATDKLFRERHVIHVSYSSRVDHIISWYEDIFKEIAKKRNLEDAVDIHDELVKNRVIMNFNKGGVSIDHVLSSLGAMINQGHFSADSIIFDGISSDKLSIEDLALIKKFAVEHNLEIWMSVSLVNEEPLFDESGMAYELKDLSNNMDVLLTLKYEGDHICFNVIKDHDNKDILEMHLKLDSKTLLIAEE
jgi:KaiC/GvpD/RAD55 family RecA-like ATPase